MMLSVSKISKGRKVDTGEKSLADALREQLNAFDFAISTVICTCDRYLGKNLSLEFGLKLFCNRKEKKKINNVRDKMFN